MILITNKQTNLLCISKSFQKTKALEQDDKKNVNQISTGLRKTWNWELTQGRGDEDGKKDIKNMKAGKPKQTYLSFSTRMLEMTSKYLLPIFYIFFTFMYFSVYVTDINRPT